MFTILLVTFLLIATLTTHLVIRFISPPLRSIFERLAGKESGMHWSKFAVFTLYVGGISRGVDARHLERYIQKTPSRDIIPLSIDSCVFEAYQTVVRSLLGITWTATAIFTIALIAFIIVRAFELKNRDDH